VSAPQQPSSSYEELAAQVTALVGEVRALRAENAELKRRLGMSSTNSSVPPSKDSIAAKAQQKAQRSSGEQGNTKRRRRGGQKGRTGSGLTPTTTPDRTVPVDPPAECSGCGADLADSADAGTGWAQVWDIPPIVLQRVHYLLPRRRCGCCGKTTIAVAPYAQAGAVVYGPDVNAAAVLLGSEGNVPIERTAMLMEALLGTPVSVGFVARAQARVAQRLATAGFDEAMTDALRAEDVLCADETPVNVLRKDLDADGQPEPGQPQAVVIRTPDARLVWYAATGSRSGEAIKALGVLDGYRGYLVSDDYAGYQQFDPDLAGRQQCCAHLLRYLAGVRDLGPQVQAWAGRVAAVLREAHNAVTTALAAGRDRLDPRFLDGLRARYDKAVRWGVLTNRHRDWYEGNHPGYKLATRLQAKADQVWLFTTVFAVPWTNNASEQAVKSPKLHQKVSGYWHTTSTLGAFCRVRSYLVSARGHGIRAIDAIHAALAGNPWLPAPVTG
jgi:hypothetical protein